MRDVRHWVIVGVACLLPISVLVVVSALASQADADGYASRTHLSTISVEEVALNGAVQVSLALKWGDPPALISPAWEGTVTALGAAPGDRLTSGQRLLQINGVWRLALHTATPLYEPISSASAKSQQRIALDALQSLGYVRSSAAWTSAVTAGVRALARDLGVSARGAVDALDPSWFVWLPSDSVVLDTWKVTVGAPAPGAGAEVAVMPPPLTAITLDTDASGTTPAQQMESGESRQLTIAGATATISALPVRDRSVLTTFSGPLSADHPEKITGTISMVTAERGWRVPTASVYIDRDGRTCLAAPGRSMKPRALPVTVLPGGDIGVASVRSSAAHGDLSILSDTRNLPEDFECR